MPMRHVHRPYTRGRRPPLAPVLGCLSALALGLSASVQAATVLEAPRPQVAIRRAAQSVQVDGRLDPREWAGATKLTLPPMVQTRTPSASDLRATAYLLWQPEQLLLAIDVTDNRLVYPRRADDTLDKGDHVDIWVNQLNFQVGFSSAGKAALAAVDLASWQAPDTSGVRYAVGRRRGGYVVELALPRSALALTLPSLAPNGALRLAVGVRDYDQADQTEPKSLYLPADWGWNDVESFAQAKLAS